MLNKKLNPMKISVLAISSGFTSFSFLNSCDLDWIQTSNLLSRNQVRYSVAPRGLFAVWLLYIYIHFITLLRVQI